MKPSSLSIVIPARNEEVYLPRCLAAIAKAQAKIEVELEIILVANRCTDRTVEIAEAAGCRIVHDESKNLSRIRNAGARVATGEFLVTVDADSFLSENMLRDVLRKLQQPKYIGGGVVMFPERWSLGIFLTGLCLVPLAIAYGWISGGLFFCRREDFLAIGGFNEELVSAEDLDFAYRLKMHGKKKGMKFTTIFSSWIITSCRKFDRLGDWFFFKNPRAVIRALRGRDQKIADEFWYDFKH